MFWPENEPLARCKRTLKIATLLIRSQPRTLARSLQQKQVWARTGRLCFLSHQTMTSGDLPHRDRNCNLPSLSLLLAINVLLQG